jgi:hypothetical protein
MSIQGGMMKLALLSFVLLLQFFPASAHAAFYEWGDAEGVTHFTDNPDKIPARYRARAKKLKLSEEAAPARAAEPVPQAAPEAAEPAGPSFGGQPEQWWRDQFSVLRRELKALQDGLSGKQEKLAELRRKRVIYSKAQDRVALNSLQAEVSVDEVRIAELQQQIAELERRAVRASVPLDWRQ